MDKVVAGRVVECARVDNGVAVKAGVPEPDVRTPEAFKRVMIEMAVRRTNGIQPVAGTEYLGRLPAELMEYGPIGVGLLAVPQQREISRPPLSS